VTCRLLTATWCTDHGIGSRQAHHTSWYAAGATACTDVHIRGGTQCDQGYYACEICQADLYTRLKLDRQRTQQRNWGGTSRMRNEEGCSTGPERAAGMSTDAKENQNML